MKFRLCLMLMTIFFWASHLYAQIETGISYDAKSNTVTMQIKNASDNTVLAFLEEPLGDYSVSIYDWPEAKKTYPADFRVKTTQNVADGRYTLEPNETSFCKNEVPVDGKSFIVEYDMLHLNKFLYTKDARTGKWDRKGTSCGGADIVLKESFVVTPHHAFPEGQLLTSVSLDAKNKKILLRLRNVSDSIVYQFNEEESRGDTEMRENRFLLESVSTGKKTQKTLIKRGVIFKIKNRPYELMINPGEEHLVELPIDKIPKFLSFRSIMSYNKWVKASNQDNINKENYRFIGSGKVEYRNSFYNK